MHKTHHRSISNGREPAEQHVQLQPQADRHWRPDALCRFRRTGPGPAADRVERQCRALYGRRRHIAIPDGHTRQGAGVPGFQFRLHRADHLRCTAMGHSRHDVRSGCGWTAIRSYQPRRKGLRFRYPASHPAADRDRARDHGHRPGPGPGRRAHGLRPNRRRRRLAGPAADCLHGCRSGADRYRPRFAAWQGAVQADPDPLRHHRRLPYCSRARLERNLKFHPGEL